MALAVIGRDSHDHLAVAIITASDTCVRHLERDKAIWIAPRIDRGYPVNAIVERVKGAHLRNAVLGLVVRLNMEGEEPELAA